MTARGGEPDYDTTHFVPRFTPTPEAVEAARNAVAKVRDDMNDCDCDDHLARAAIAAFVEAEGLTRRAGWTDNRVRATEWTIERPLEEA